MGALQQQPKRSAVAVHAVVYIFKRRQIICEWKCQASVFLLVGGQQLCLLMAVVKLLKTHQGLTQEFKDVGVQSAHFRPS